MPPIEDLSGVAPLELPLALHALHRDVPVDGEVTVALPSDLGPWRLDDLIEGAGLLDPRPVPSSPGALQVTRGFRLADTVAPGMRLLVCGVNASLHAAEAGVGYIGPGNRFWPALGGAGAVPPGADRDPVRLLRDGRIGMTDLVKRPTPRAVDVSAEEQALGGARVERLCQIMAPAAVLLAGLSGWRAAIDRRAVAGWQPTLLGGAPVYLMPSTSGLNAATPLSALIEHVQIALAGP